MVTTRVNELALRDGDFVSGVAGVGSFISRPWTESGGEFGWGGTSVKR